jgi:hypothetical protein
MTMVRMRKQSRAILQPSSVILTTLTVTSMLHNFTKRLKIGSMPISTIETLFKSTNFTTRLKKVSAGLRKQCKISVCRLIEKLDKRKDQDSDINCHEIQINLIQILSEIKNIEKDTNYFSLFLLFHGLYDQK